MTEATTEDRKDSESEAPKVNPLAAAVGAVPTLGGQKPLVLDAETNTDVRNVGVLAPLDVPGDELYYENDLDPARRLTPTASTYYDHQERVRAEIARAQVEGREPDLDNPGPTAGSILVPASRIHNPANQNVSVNMLSVEAPAVLEGPSSMKERLAATEDEADSVTMIHSPEAIGWGEGDNPQEDTESGPVPNEESAVDTTSTHSEPVGTEPGTLEERLKAHSSVKDDDSEANKSGNPTTPSKPLP